MNQPEETDSSNSAPFDTRSWLAAIVDSSIEAIISESLDGVISTWNLAAQRLFGYSEAEAVGQPITLILPADLHDGEQEILSRVRNGERIDHYETRLVTRDGRTLDVSITVSPVKDATGCIVGASAILRDLTESKRDRPALWGSGRRLSSGAEDALTTINQQLIDAHEEERSRIARDLHDDISQRLALLTIRLCVLVRTSGTPLPDEKQKLETARDEVMNLARDVRALSHRLHPAGIESVGIAQAAADLCHEISTRRALEIRFNAESVPDDVSKGVSVSLYRVLQEALENAVKHRGGGRVEVSLRGGVGQIELTIRDFGTGLDLSTSPCSGLGLTSMKERVRAIRGRLAIWSEPQRGTTIQAIVPLA